MSLSTSWGLSRLLRNGNMHSLMFPEHGMLVASFFEHKVCYIYELPEYKAWCFVFKFPLFKKAKGAGSLSFPTMGPPL